MYFIDFLLVPLENGLMGEIGNQEAVGEVPVGDGGRGAEYGE